MGDRDRLGAELAPIYESVRGPVAWLTLATAFLVLAPSWYMMEVYDRVVNSRNLFTLGMLSLAVLALIAVLELFEWRRSEALRGASLALDDALSPRLFSLSFGAALVQGPQAANKALGHLQGVRNFLTSPALTGLLDTPAALLFLVLLWLIHPWLSVVALVAAGLQVASAWLLDRQTSESARLGAQGGAGAQAYAERMLEQAPVLEALGMRQAVTQRWVQQQGKAWTEQQKTAHFTAGHQAFSRWLQQIVGSALLGVACWLLLDDRLAGGPGMMIVASILGGRVVAPLVQVVTQWTAVVQARGAWQGLSELFAAHPAPADELPLPAPKGRLAVEQLVVTLSGPARTPLLKGLSFQLKPGEVLVVLGNSGAGKTTLARALIGILPPASGAVRLDGVDVSSWNRDELGPHLGYLPQQVNLLDGTLADNIGRFGPAEPAKIMDAVNAAGLSAFVEGLPKGIDSELGVGGAWLSGGLRQRVGLARALYGQPALVVLDEPNASLDEAGDAALAVALDALRARACTVVVMSHRKSVIGQADHLLVLRDGQQVGFGPRDDVLEALRKAGAFPAEEAPPAAQLPRTPVAPGLA